MRRCLQIAGGLVALHLLVAPPVAAQSGEGALAEAGHAPIQSISSVDYDAGPANWAATQDPSGLLYVGNDDGVLVYDGVTWQTVMLSNRGLVRSLDADSTGRVLRRRLRYLRRAAPRGRRRDVRVATRPTAAGSALVR